MEDFFSGLAFHPHVSGENGHRKRTPGLAVFLKHLLLVYEWTDENGVFRIRFMVS